MRGPSKGEDRLNGEVFKGPPIFKSPSVQRLSSLRFTGPPIFKGPLVQRFSSVRFSRVRPCLRVRRSNV